VLLLASTVALLGSATVAHGQMELAVIQGTVVDQTDGEPLKDVTVRLKDLERGTETALKTDKSGKFYRRGMRAVQYEIAVEKEGYQPIHDKLDLKAGVEGRFNFKLAKASPQGAEEFVKGVEAFNRGDAAAAATAFEQALVKAPDAPEVRINLALAYLRLKRTDAAIAQLEKAAASSPDTPRVLFQLGGAYLDARQNEKAIDAFEKGLKRQSDLTDPLAYEATVTLGAAYFATGRNDESIATFEKAIAARPDAPAPKLGLAKAAFSKGDVDLALKHFKEVAASAPGSAEATEAETFIKELEKTRKSGGSTTR
jgi:tetratricopeptide (TPR) repeat protein